MPDEPAVSKSFARRWSWPPDYDLRPLQRARRDRKR